MKLNPEHRLFDPAAKAAFEKLPEEEKQKSKAAKSFILYPQELHFKQRQRFEIKEDESLFLIKEHLKIFKKPYIASSHGSDSIIMVHLVLRAVKELQAEGYDVQMPEVWLNNTLNIYKEEPAYWKLINKLFGIEDKFKVFTPPRDKEGRQYTVWSIAEERGHLPHFRQSANAKDKTKGDGGEIPACCKILKKDAIKDYLKTLPKDERFDLHFVGIRAEESRIRKLGVMQRCRSYQQKYRAAYPIHVVTPLSFWTAKTWKDHQGEYIKTPRGNVFTPYEGETAPENDITLYYAKHNIPRNPVYEIHKQERMGCASCPAHRFWELRLARDPTAEGLGMLRRNLMILKDTEPQRYAGSITLLKKHKLVPNIIAELEGTKSILSYK